MEWYRRRRSPRWNDPKLAMCLQILLKIVFGVIKVHSSSSKNLVNFHPSPKPEHAAHLAFVKGSGSVAVKGQRLEGSPGEITPFLLQRLRHVLRQLDAYVHWHTTLDSSLPVSFRASPTGDRAPYNPNTLPPV